MDIVFASLGSKGNATLIQEGDTLIQIDMGVSLKCVRAGLEILGKSFSDIQALFITHEHSDHIKGLTLYHDRLPVFTGEGTLPGIPEERFLHEGEAIEIGDLMVLPFRSSHDAVHPFNFVILGGGKKFGYVTDTGYIRTRGLKALKNCDYYLMESNYDVEMLMHGSYPPPLKRRIHGKQGHLSNIDSALYCCEIIGPKTKQIFLGHISDENNLPEVALKTYKNVFKEQNVDIEGIQIIAIPQQTLQIGGNLL